MSKLNFGGTELRTAELVPRLATAGVETHIVTLSQEIGAGPLADLVRQHGGTITPLPLDLRFPARFLRLLRQLRPNAVHVDCANFSGFVLTLAKVGGIPVRIAHFRGDDNQPRNMRRRANRWFFGRLLRLSATDILGVSPGSLTFGYDREWRNDQRCQVVLNGLDIDRLLLAGHDSLRTLAGAGPDDLLCVNVGRGAPDKRRSLLPPILAALRAADVPAHVFLIGPDEHDDDLLVRAAAAEHHLSSRVHILGARDDVGSLLRQADVVIHPSCVEGLPGGVLEPVALGIGTVASNLPGVRFIDEHLPGVTIVETVAAPEVWAAAVLNAAQHTASTDPAEAVHRFTRSVFAIDEAVVRHLAIYRRPRTQESVQPHGARR
jgi:glycosyltransferase involved in cell wall biosynthesis